VNNAVFAKRMELVQIKQKRMMKGMSAEQLFCLEGVTIAVKEIEAIISEQIRQGAIEGSDIPTVLITAEEIATKK